MKKYDLKDSKMNRKTLLLACLAAFGLSGCVMNRTDQTQRNAVYNNTDQVLCPDGICESDPFINYTQTRAPYRQYGELSPRDHLVSQSGAGNNVSAAIPPSIENEVISYEEQVESQVVAPNENLETAAATETAAETPDTVAETTGTPAATEGTTQETVTATEEAQSSESEDEYADEDPVQDWYAEEGQNLKALLTKWSEESGWRLVWNTNRNYVLNAGAMFRGRFADVSSALIRAFARARPAPVATFYKGNRVLVVETMEDENAYD